MCVWGGTQEALTNLITLIELCINPWKADTARKSLQSPEAGFQ